MYHKCRRLAANTGEMECMVWDVMFYINLTVLKGNVCDHFHCKYKKLIIFIIAYFILHNLPFSVLHVLFLKTATENYSLK